MFTLPLQQAGGVPEITERRIEAIFVFLVLCFPSCIMRDVGLGCFGFELTSLTV